MDQGSHEFVLVGYSLALERRPLKFVDPIPATLICSACGHIPRLTFSLLCGHVFCEPCYQSFATTTECVCPLDGDVSGADDVTSKKYPPDNLLKRKVHCWNEVNGCSVVLPASEIAEHVHHDCQHHVTRCAMCSAAVLIRNVCAHLKSRCTALIVHAAPEAQPRADVKDMTHLLVFEEKIEQRVRGLDSKLAQLSFDTSSQSDKLVELCHNNNILKEALTEQLRTASVQTLDRLGKNEAAIKALVTYQQRLEQRVGELDTKLGQLPAGSGTHSDKLCEVSSKIDHLKEALTNEFGTTLDRHVADIKALSSEHHEFFMTTIPSVLTSAASNPKAGQRVIKDYAALKGKALKDGLSTSWSDKVYLLRYSVSWGIEFRKEGDGVWLSLCLQLHEGTEDDFLEWPFTKELQLSIIHPETRQERLLCETPNVSGKLRKFYCRPIGGSNGSLRFGATKVDANDIERDGYVENDQLLVRLEVGL